MREKNKLLDETTWRIIREAKGIAGWVAVSAVLGILAVLCAIAAPEILGNLIQKLYDFGLSDRQTPIRDTLVSGLTLLTAVYAAQSLFRYLNMQLMNRAVSRHFTYGLRIAISDKIRRLPVKYVDQTPVGDILNRMIDDVGEMGGYIHQIFDVMVEGAFQIAMIAVAMFLENGVLACLVIVLTPVSLWISSKIAGVCGKYYDECFEKAGELTEIVEESFTNFATAKAYNLEEYTAQNHAVVNEQLRKAVSKANFTGSIVQPLIKFANAMAYICINLIGGWLIVRRGVGVGTVVTIVLFARQFASCGRCRGIGKSRSGGGTLYAGVHICLVVIAYIHEVVISLYGSRKGLQPYIIGTAVTAKGYNLEVFLYLAFLLQHLVGCFNACSSCSGVFKGAVNEAVLIGGIRVHKG